MLFGRSILHLIVVVLVFVAVFVIAKFLFAYLFGALGIGVPDLVLNAIAFLVALGFGYGGWSYTYRSGPVA